MSFKSIQIQKFQSITLLVFVAFFLFSLFSRTTDIVFAQSASEQENSQIILSSSPNAAIPDGGAAVGNYLTSIITVSEDVIIADISVAVDITHPDAGDLSVELVKPDRNIITLRSSQASGGNGPVITNISETYTTTLSDLIGTNARGDWKLRVVDFDASGNTGTLNSWTLTIAPLVPLVFSDSPHIAIPDGGAAVGNFPTSTITVSEDVTIADISVAVDITHPDAGDLSVDLVKPDGNVITLRYSQASGGNGPVITNISETYTTTLSGLTGTNARGDWTLRVADFDANGNTGTLNSWTLTLVPLVPLVPLVFSDSPHIAIPDGGAAVGNYLTSIITVSEDVIIADISVAVDITHPDAGDLSVDLVKPDGNVIILRYSQASGGNDPVITNISETYTTTLSDLIGTNARGDWKLRVADFDANGNTGTLNSWTLTLVPLIPLASLVPLVPLVPLVFSDSPHIAIPDGGAVVGNLPASTITVSEDVTIADISVAVDITHPDAGDLSVDLVKPDGNVITLRYSQASGGNDPVITNISETYTTKYITTLSDLIGTNARGDWKLRVADFDADGNTGTLNSWTLTLAPLVPLVFSDSPHIAIPDGGAVVGNLPASTIIVSEGVTIADISVAVDITHPDAGNLSVELVKPDGNIIILRSRSQASGGNDPVITNISETYTTTLSGLIGTNARGDWTLRVADFDANGNTGTLNSWTLTILPKVR